MESLYEIEEEVRRMMRLSYTDASFLEVLIETNDLKESECLETLYWDLFEWAKKNNRLRVIAYLCSEVGCISNSYFFMRDILLDFLSYEHISKLDRPCWDGYLSFNSIIRKFLKIKDIKSYKKRFGKVLREQGTKGLNNLIYICSLFGKDDLDIHLNFNPSKTITKTDFELLEKAKKVFGKYLDEPVLYKVLITHFDTDYSYNEFRNLTEDTIRILEEVETCKYFENFKSDLSKKCKSIKEFHDNVVELYSYHNADLTGLEYHQEITFLDGSVIAGYEVYVPKTDFQLYDLSRVFKNCVFSYRFGIEDSLFNIFALKKDGKFKYCVEIRLIEGFPLISEVEERFKGSKYEDEAILLIKDFSDELSRRWKEVK